MISEADILNSFQHLVEDYKDDSLIAVGSGDDAAVIKSQSKDLIHEEIIRNLKKWKLIK